MKVLVRISDQQPENHPNFRKKRSRSLGAALGEFRGILGAALGIQILGIRDSILGMASHDLSNTKTTILRATPGAIPRIDGNPHGRLSLPLHSPSVFFQEMGGSHAQESTAEEG